MRHLKSIGILCLSLLILSCSKDDDSSGDALEAIFTAAINGGSFNNYTAKLGFYDASSSQGTLTISVTDDSNNVIRIFVNSTGGLSGGVIKQVGDVDSNGFGTNVTIRDQAAQITYSSIDGSITIARNIENPDNEQQRLVSGSFNITASTNTGDTVTMTGSYENIAF